MNIESKYERYLEMNGDNFKKIRKVACITQADICELCHVSRSTIVAFEADKGVTNPSTKLLLWATLDNLVHENVDDIVLTVWNTFTGIC